MTEFTANNAKELTQKSREVIASFRKEVDDVTELIKVAAKCGDTCISIPKLPWQITYRLEQLGYDVVQGHDGNTQVYWSAG